MVRSRKFLMKVYEDVTAEMRCRRNFESQLVHYYFLFYTLVGIATVTLFQEGTTHELFPMIFSGIFLLIVIMASFCTFRIIYDHKKYAEFGQIAVRVWKYSFLLKPPFLSQNKFSAEIHMFKRLHHEE